MLRPWIIKFSRSRACGD